jgi:hypothetical protein
MVQFSVDDCVGKKRVYTAANAGEQTQNDQQRHHNWIWQSDAENFGFVPTAPKCASEIPADHACVSAKPEANGRSETHNTQAEANPTAQGWLGFKVDLVEVIESGHGSVVKIATLAVNV